MTLEEAFFSASRCSDAAALLAFFAASFSARLRASTLRDDVAAARASSEYKREWSEGWVERSQVAHLDVVPPNSQYCYLHFSLGSEGYRGRDERVDRRGVTSGGSEQMPQYIVTLGFKSGGACACGMESTSAMARSLSWCLIDQDICCVFVGPA